MTALLRMGALVAVLALAAPDVHAQCVVCRMTGETNLKDGGQAAKGLNRGILYLLTLPYLMIGGIGYIWWRNRRQVAEAEQEMEIRALLESHDVLLVDNAPDETRRS